jgi:uncharacterized protein (TIGR02453 family)
MLQASTVQFISKLKKNNNKAWMDANRSIYLDADFEQFVQKVINGIAAFDTSIEGLDAKKCTFRLNRDIRFSKDKSPYKTNMGASVNKGGKKAPSAGYYFHCEPGGSFVGGGLYMPMPPELGKVRQEIDYNFAEWKKMVTAKSFLKQFPKGVDGIELLSRPPKGYDINNPAVEYLKMKSFTAFHPIDDAALSSKTLLKETLKTFETLKPMLDFLNRGMD